MKEIVPLFSRALILILIIWSAENISAQYYDWGQEPSSIKWRQTETSNGKLVFPDQFEKQALRLKQYMDTIRPYVGYGFSHGPMKMPLVTHTQNFSSNGLVILAPRRMEFIVTPPASTFAMPWLKQLTAHEYRHSVQYNNVNRGTIRVLSYILGEQGSLVGAALLPYWMMEGDAVLTETQMSNYGRGLQPSFTIDYRAMAMEGKKKFVRDKYFSGSYRHHIPDQYHLGYQMTSFAYTKYGENIWNKVAWYGSRNPFFILTTKISLNKYYKTSVNRLFDETIDDIFTFWKNQPLEENSTTVIETPITSYTTYTTPVYENDSTVYAIKSDFDRYSRIVKVDLPSGNETKVLNTGYINTGLILHNGKLWWTEIRQSTFWEQRVNSQLCFFDIQNNKKGVVKDKRHVMFASCSPDENIATVVYDYSGFYSICHNKNEYALPDTISVHGLTYDDNTRNYYFIGLSDQGMWIGSLDDTLTGFDIVKKPGYSSLSGLRASSGKLYYGSISSGKDEVHIYDLSEDKEYTATSSRYGSFDPSAEKKGSNIILTTYTPQGYLLAVQGKVEEIKKESPSVLIPENRVNPERIKWEIMNLDSLKAIDNVENTVKKYRKGFHLFNFHSWAPVYFEPNDLLDESNPNIGIGLTLLSQNLLNSTFTTLGYKYTDEGSYFTAKFNYYGLAPKFEVEAKYGTMDQRFYKPSNLIINRDLGFKNYFGIEARVYLPVLLNSGYHIRTLTPLVELEHENSKLYYPGNYYPAKFKNGLEKLRLSLQYSDYVRMAHRDFLPRWGYYFRVTHTSNPFNNDFGKILSGYGRFYLPGLFPHHSLMLRGAIQRQGVAYYNFRQKELFPRGADYDFTPERYGSFSVDYQLPICYPDGGINSILYLKRIRTNLSFDYAKYKTYRREWKDIHSYGIDITFDIVPVRLPSNNTTSLTITIHNPSDRNGIVLGANLTIPL